MVQKTNFSHFFFLKAPLINEIFICTLAKTITESIQLTCFGTNYDQRNEILDLTIPLCGEEFKQKMVCGEKMTNIRCSHLPLLQCSEVCKQARGTAAEVKGIAGGRAEK